MEIKDILPVGNKQVGGRDRSGAARGVDKGAASDSGAQASRAAQDKVELSGRSREMQKAAETLSATPEIRQEKVAAIKASIENNTYEVDADKVAHKMIVEFLSEIV